VRTYCNYIVSVAIIKAFFPLSSDPVPASRSIYLNLSGSVQAYEFDRPDALGGIRTVVPSAGPQTVHTLHHAAIGIRSSQNFLFQLDVPLQTKAV
jgi:hypothetical protein